MSVFSDVYVRNSLNVAGKIISTDTSDASIVTDGGILVKQNSIFNNNVTIEGDLTVNGTTKTIQKQTLDIEDPYITLAKGNKTDTQNIGILMEYEEEEVKYSGLYRNATDKSFYVFNNASGLPNEVFSTGAEPEPSDYADFNAAVITAHSDVDSNDSTTGALIVKGGVGIGQNLNVGGDVKAPSIQVTEIVNTNSLQSDGITTNTIKVNSNVISDDLKSGALIVTGGVGIGKNLNVGEDVKIESVTQSTNPTTGALVVAGGVGIGENLNVGGDVNITGSLTASSIDFKVEKLSTETINTTTELLGNCKAVIFASREITVTLPALDVGMMGKLIQIVNVGSNIVTVTVKASYGDYISTFVGDVPISPWASLSLVGYYVDGNNKRWIIR